MKKLLYVLTGLCLLAGAFTGCEKPNSTREEGDNTATKNYTETAFGMNLEMVYVEGGEFTMGFTSEQGWDLPDSIVEKFTRETKLDSYHIGKYEVTQAQWKAVMGMNSSYFKDDNLPVENVSWNDVQEFCKKLSKKAGRKYMLPTEAQWEYAARGGNKSQHYKYAGSNDIDEVAWYYENSYDHLEYPEYGTHLVGMKKANELGLYDMSGNVQEWCLDWYSAVGYDKKDDYNPQGSVEGSNRVMRGGNWKGEASGCCVSSISCCSPDARLSILGFRVVCLAE
ncbi:MAG: formylglycine-generating enzyme family protein [Bacteroidales bacterium]|nr:formylglycine-generating enzyme family protein [Bacteroidales bacterium]